MKRLIFVGLAFLVGCNGMGSGASRFLPGGPAASAPDSAAAGGLRVPDARAERTKMHLTLTIPRRHRGDRAQTAHPATISPLTQSIGVVVNSAAAQIFTATPSSAACHIGTGGTVCTFVVNAPVGSDTFVITTYSGAAGSGAKLDQGSAVFNVVKGQNNAPSIRLGPVVTTTANTGVGSLRYAIGAANAGDSIMLLLPAGSKIVLATPLTVSNRVSIAGPGVSASARRRGERPRATYTGISISGNGTQQIFSIQAGSTVAISGLILTQGKATVNSGGAVSNLGTLTLTGDVLTANTTTIAGPLAIRAHHVHGVRHEKATSRKATHREPVIRHPHCSDTFILGGAVYNNGTLIVTGTTFDGNTVSSAPATCVYGYGGAIFNDANGQLFSSGNLYTHNAAYDGGAIYNYDTNGQASFSGDTFSANQGCTAATGCPTSGCTTSCTSSAYGDGAAIYDSSGPGVTIANSVFENNVVGGHTPDSDGYAGALYLDTGGPSITATSFTSNLAGGGASNVSEGYGGAIYWCGDTSMQINNDTFTGNQAGGDYYGEGGAIDACEGFSGSNDVFTSNVAFGNGSAQENGTSEGGAIYEDSGMSLSNCTFKQNVATGSDEGDGGALYVDDPATITSSTFTSNATVGTGATGDDSYAEGGAIYNNDGVGSSNNAYTSNTATAKSATAYDAYGGAIYSDDTLSTTHDTYASNAAVSIGGSAPSSYGGAIYNNDGMTMTGDTLSSNSASGSYESYGGALYSDDSTTAISNSSFTANAASGGYEGWGGAIYDADGLQMGGTVISGNTATHRGGGFYADTTGADTLANVTISGNRVTGGSYEDGGGGYYNASSLQMTNSTISGNSATVNGTYAGGGGLYSDGSLSITGTTISGNAVLGSAPSGSGGGGLFIYDGGIVLNSTITANTSTADGGGLQNDGTGLTFTNATFSANTAAGMGGNVSNTDTMAIGNSIVGGGTATTGPDVSNSGTLTSDDYNVIQTAVAGTALSGTTTHNQQVNPLLLALTTNGGPTFTMADQFTSPGRADIPFATSMCDGASGTNIDQRGFTRGAGGRCDAGAYEFAGVASAARPAPVPPVHGRHHHAPHAKHVHAVHRAH